MKKETKKILGIVLGLSFVIVASGSLISQYNVPSLSRAIIGLLFGIGGVLLWENMGK
jgi:hypothetical protein